MKLILGLLGVLSISCGSEYKIGGRSGSSVGATRSLAPVTVSQTERANLTTICNALAQKESQLNTIAGSTFSFQASQSDCEGNVISSGVLNVVLQNALGEYVFRRSDGVDFIFPNVETTDSGMLAQVCPNVSNISNPIQAGQDFLYVSAFEGMSDCPSVSGELCVRVERASAADSSAVVHTVDIMRVRLPQANARYAGFFSLRKRLARSFCAQNEFIYQEATIK
jgi:hypothetical protein